MYRPVLKLNPTESLPQDREVIEQKRRFREDQPTFRTVGLTDPFLNEMYCGRLNQDWMNPFPTLDDDEEAAALHRRKGDMLDKLTDIEEFEDNALEKLKRLNIMNLDHHFDIGGFGHSEMEALHITEILSKDISLLNTFRNQKYFGVRSLLYGATDEVLKKYLNDVTNLKRTIGFCLSEAEARSDISDIQTRAVLAEGGEHWLISGKKTRVLIHQNTNLFVVFAQTRRNLDEESKLTAFLVDLEATSGDIEVSPGDNDLSLDGLKFADIVFSDVAVPSSNILGELGEGFYLALTLQSLSRYSLGAEFAEIQRTFLQYMTKYVKLTKQFGKPLAEFPLVRSKLATLAENVYASESLAYLVGGKLTEIEEGGDYALYASECAAVQLKAREYALQSLNICIELLGTRAFSSQSREIFDQLINIYATSALAGSPDVLRLFIAQSGYQFRAAFDNEYFGSIRQGDRFDKEWRRRRGEIANDAKHEISNFTDNWKSDLALRRQAGVMGAIMEEMGMTKPESRVIHANKMHGLLGGRWTRLGQRSGHGANAWLELMLHECFKQLVTDVDDFGKRNQLILATHGKETENLQVTLARSADVVCNFFSIVACIGRCNKTVRLGLNNYEDEVTLCHNISNRYTFKNQLDMHAMMAWNLKKRLVDPSREHVAKKCIHEGRYPFATPVSLAFDFTQNPEYLDKLDNLRTLSKPDTSIETFTPSSESDKKSDLG